MSPSALLIADCGATSGKWAYVDRASGSTVRFTTGPVNASIHDLTRITTELVTACRQCPSPPSALHVFAAGAIGDSASALAEAAAGVFSLPRRAVRVESDLVGAAEALLGPTRGVACIIGTGSNSCLWSGSRIIRHMPPMGYILGDEGSGAAIGAALLRAAIRRQLPAPLLEAWDADYPSLDYAAVVDSVYRRHAGSSFIASFVPFAARHIEHTAIAAIVDDAFGRFFAALASSYPELTAGELDASFTGGVACAFAPNLRHAAESRGISVGSIIRDPLDSLVARALSC